MSKKVISNLIYFIFLAVGIYLVWWQLTNMSATDKEEFLQSLKSIDYRFVGLVVLMMGLAHYVRALRWNILINAIGHHPPSFTSFSAIMAGYLANSFIPRLGEVVRCTTLSRTGNYRLDKIFGTVIAERITDLVSYFLFLLLTILLQLNFIKETIGELFGGFANNPALPSKILVYSIVVLAILLLTKFILNRFAHFHLIRRLKEILKGILAGIKSLWHMEKRWQYLGYTVLIWSLYITQMYLGFKAIEDVSHLGIPVAFSILALSTLSMIITPGGLGTFPIFVMQTLSLYHISPSIGKAFGWLVWGANTAFSISVGLICFFYLTWLSNKFIKKNSGA